jgi:hypothetical protein
MLNSYPKRRTCAAASQMSILAPLRGAILMPFLIPAVRAENARTTG